MPATLLLDVCCTSLFCRVEQADPVGDPIYRNLCKVFPLLFAEMDAKKTSRIIGLSTLLVLHILASSTKTEVLYSVVLLIAIYVIDVQAGWYFTIVQSVDQAVFRVVVGPNLHFPITVLSKRTGSPHRSSIARPPNQMPGAMHVGEQRIES